MPADETTDPRPPRGAPSPSPPHPHPSQVPPAAQVVGGGCKPAYGTLGWEARRGHWSAGAGGLVALRRTDDGGRTMGGTIQWRGAAEYALWTERRQKGRKERGYGQDVLQARHPDESRMWGERKEPNSARTVNIEFLKIGTESRGNHSLCSGLE